MPRFSIVRPSKIYPKWDFWFENEPSGNPAPSHVKLDSSTGQIQGCHRVKNSYLRRRMPGRFRSPAADAAPEAADDFRADSRRQREIPIIVFDMKFSSFSTLWEPGLPDFSWHKIPKRDKTYQISTNFTKCQ
jgi:hypothetical protein